MQFGSNMTLNYLSEFRNIKSQLLQDVFVLSALDRKKKGYFIEAGASDGIDLSNTFLLEKNFGWSGLLVEPSRTSFRKLSSNRISLSFNVALWSESNLDLHFTETKSPGLSTITTFKENDFLAQDRKVLKQYEVPTISLMDLLRNNNAPREIDYLSLDTEGSEYEILKDFDFSHFYFSIISVEHGWNENNRDLVRVFLQGVGYFQIRPELTEYESWFISPELFEKFKRSGYNSLVQLD
jgi:FkbM family methyltransferase